MVAMKQSNLRKKRNTLHKIIKQAKSVLFLSRVGYDLRCQSIKQCNKDVYQTQVE